MAERAAPGRGRRRGTGRRRPGASRVRSGSPVSPAGCRSPGGRRSARTTACSCSARPDASGRSRSRRRGCSAPPTSSRPAATPNGLERALALGADEAVALDGDFGEPTYVFDPLCGEPLERAVAAAAPGRAIVQLGQSAGPTATLPSAAIRGKQLELYGFSDLRASRRRACGALPAARRRTRSPARSSSTSSGSASTRSATSGAGPASTSSSPSPRRRVPGRSRSTHDSSPSGRERLLVRSRPPSRPRASRSANGPLRTPRLPRLDGRSAHHPPLEPRAVRHAPGGAACARRLCSTSCPRRTPGRVLVAYVGQRAALARVPSSRRTGPLQSYDVARHSSVEDGRQVADRPRSANVDHPVWQTLATTNSIPNG